ncbi:MAG: thiamine phosphate synthase, partial [Sutterella wadsworthensis]
MSDNYRVLRALRLYLVLDPGLCGGSQGLVRTAQAAAAAGVTAVQLRAPDWKKRLYAECGRELLKVLAPYDVPLFINDHADVAVAIGAHGVHVGQSDLSPEDCHRLMTPGMMLGLSVSNVAECLGVDPALVDYIGIGPYRA